MVSLPILGAVIGDGFAAILAAAQEGSETAFSRLWRDANPALLRYLRVIAPAAAEDIAADTWLQVVRGLAGFRGDEQAWRAWLFTTARRRAVDEGRRRSRGPRRRWMRFRPPGCRYRRMQLNWRSSASAPGRRWPWWRGCRRSRRKWSCCG
jgi:DNA-directed RNA polymerase specialized sigma24 family protein